MVNQQPQIGYLLKQAQSLLRVRMEDALRPLGLTVSQYSCLHHLRREPGISAAVLARNTFMTRQSMTALLQGLLDRGLVTRSDHPEAGRALPTVLTAAGSVEKRMLAGLTPAQQSALARGLVACTAALQD